MKIRLKPKAFGPIHVHVDGEGRLFENLGADGRSALESPVDAVLYGLAACIGRSIRLAAGTGIAVGPIDVVVEVRVAPGFVPDDDTAAGLLAKAKKICTVSNTLTAEVSLSLTE